MGILKQSLDVKLCHNLLTLLSSFLPKRELSKLILDKNVAALRNNMNKSNISWVQNQAPGAWTWRGGWGGHSMDHCRL